MFYYILMIILGFTLLVIGSNILVKVSSDIARKFHIPDVLVGLTIVALGTSFPELIITITSSSDLIIGNAIGSNLCNLLFILGFIAIIKPVKIDIESRDFHIPMALLSSVVILLMGLGVLGNNSHFINQKEGFFLILLFFTYFSFPIIKELKKIVYSYKVEKANRNQKDKTIYPIRSLALIILGIILLKYGGDLVFNSASEIALLLKLSEKVIGLTIIAIGTALPEFITSLVAVIYNDTDLAVGNLVGSCILNLFLILGVGALIRPLEFTSYFIQHLFLLCCSTLFLWFCNFVGKKDTLTRPKGLILLAIFISYIVSLFV